ncbi:MAG TPA: asparagine synthase, partial [Candidatus Atribacteria bacterium]|nr:asparagine synthase [Candidatus Atribacteria bacterium]
LPDTYLEKVDKASMAVGLEARVPFLDHNLVEFAFSIPANCKIRGITTKYILKKAMSRFLPRKVLKKRKHGFAVPTEPWFRNELKNFAFEIIMDDLTYRRGFLNKQYVEKIYQDHLSGRQVRDYHLWLLLNFELWCRQYLDQN